MLVAGLEPARSCPRGILSPLRLPIPPQRLDFQKQSNDSAALFPKHFKSIAKRAANVNDFRPLTQKNHCKFVNEILIVFQKNFRKCGKSLF